MSDVARSRNVSIGVLAVALSAAIVAVLTLAHPAAAATTLRGLAEADGRYFGTALTDGDLNISGEMNIANVQFDMVTPGNEMKWDTTESRQNSFNFGPGDQIVSWAKAHNARVRGHNLVWHAQLPGWVNSLPGSQVKAAMENHITTEATHYKGQLYAWDVVNEPFNEDGSLRQDVFYNNDGGSAYIADALRTARAADPGAKLYLNDYNIEGQNAKSNGMYNLVSSLKAQGVPIDGVGLESHFIAGQVPSSLQANMQRFADLGLDVAITELDDRIQLPASSSSLQQQANDYAAVTKACLAVTRCVGISQWGVDDGHSWIPGTFPGYGAATMYDNNYQPKPAYNSTVSALSSVTNSSSSTPTTTPSTTPSSTSSTLPNTYCKVVDEVNGWNTGLTESITITNTGTLPIENWRMVFTLRPGQTITSGWNANYSPNSGQVTATNVSYNGSLPPGGSTTIGFQATHTGDAGAATGFNLNGATCTTG